MLEDAIHFLCDKSGHFRSDRGHGGGAVIDIHAFSRGIFPEVE